MAKKANKAKLRQEVIDHLLKRAVKGDPHAMQLVMSRVIKYGGLSCHTQD